MLVVAACASGPTIRSNRDESVDFTQFRTFAFFEPLGTDRSGHLSLISQQLVAATVRELTARGLQRVDTNPDLLVNFNADLDQRLRVTQSPTTSWGGIYSHRRGYGTWPSHRESVRPYTQGTLVIDVVDPARRQLVWEGLAVSRITPRAADDIGPVLDDAVARIFERFPLPPR